MKKTLFKILFVFLFFLTILFLKPNTVKAQGLEVTCDGSSCTLSSPDPLFSTSQDGLWYPGKSIAKTLRIRNNHPTDTITVSTNAQNPQRDSPPCELDKQLFLSIVRVGAPPLNSFVWGGSLNNFYQQISIPLAVFSPSTFDDFIFTVTLPGSVGNECQDKTTSFNLLLNFSGETITPISTPTPTPTTAAGGGGGAGAVLGAGVSAPVCSDTKPGTPTGLTATATGPGSVLLTWTPPSLSYTYFLIAYSDNPAVMKWGNPDVGNVTTYTVSGLGAGSYWFWVRAGNGCMPGDFTGSVTVGPIAGAPGVPPGGIAPGFAPGVLGVATSEAKLTTTISPGPAIAGEVKGAEEKAFCTTCFWWPILLGEAVILFLYRRFVLKKETLDRKNKKFILTISIPALSYAVFLLLNKCLKVKFLFFVESNNIFCRYFIIFTLLIYIVYLLVWKRQVKKLAS